MLVAFGVMLRNKRGRLQQSSRNHFISLQTSLLTFNMNHSKRLLCHWNPVLKRVVLALALLRFMAVVASASTPNILFIMADDLNTDLGFMGDATAITPNLDQFAKEATVFNKAYCQAPICGPSRNSLLTGLYPHNSGLYSLDPRYDEVPEYADLVSLPLLFRNNGYSTKNAGKIYHTWADPKAFENNYGWFGGFGPFPEKKIHDPGFGTHQFFDWGPYLEEPETSDYKIAQKAIELIRASKDSDKPFFIAAGFMSPHAPLYAPQRWFDIHPVDSIPPLEDQSEDMKDISPYALKHVSYGGQQKYSNWIHESNLTSSYRQAYRACVSHTDYCVGLLLDALKEEGLEENTIIVFLSDHGVQLGRKNLWKKRTLWEATAQVPMIIKAPGNVSPLRVDVPVGMIDIYPTLCDLVGIAKPEHLEGLSLIGLMEGGKASKQRKPVLTSHGPGNFALRDARWRFIRYADGSEELYDHNVDPDEHTNLANNPEYAPVIATFSPLIPKTSRPFAPGSKGLASGAFPGK